MQARTLGQPARGQAHDRYIGHNGSAGEERERVHHASKVPIVERCNAADLEAGRWPEEPFVLGTAPRLRVAPVGSFWPKRWLRLVVPGRQIQYIGGCRSDNTIC